MNSEKIRRLVKKCKVLKPTFIGVYARDNLPTRRLSELKSWALIINLDTINQPGSHWVAIYIPQKKSYMEYFDSTGRPPYHQTIIHFLKQRKYYLYNDKVLQSVYTTTCGQYCLFYLCSRAHGIDYIDILNLFKINDTLYNDRLVNRVVGDIFKTKVKLINHDFLKSMLQRLILNK